ncbi:phage terminase family protein [Clostridium estertheticum]|uniref:terminase TerL endonuclease subunit n=1 Tax=Clostridium estertheticum TaxID=238834 RepID=UPI001C6F0204|nr:terminase TerL endonuclease subunit [Clostridium estertheticum]MBW9170770.1 phage terminase family protein [Clostridium estertheticum]WLC74391.1 phage terminase family protein [Clostridium estertheticum]
MQIKDSNAYVYCDWCLVEDNEQVGIYVKKQAREWKAIVDDANEEAYVDKLMFDKICGILKLMIHPDLHCSMFDGMEMYQWFFVVATLCTMNREDNSRYYETSLLEISRKNFKTFSSAIVFIITMLLEPHFSRFFSVAPDYKLSNELRLAIRKIIKSSPLLINEFVIKRDMISCKKTEIDYVPLAYSNDGMDGKLSNIFLGDEAGAMDDYPVEAMRSSQITLDSKLGIIISTQYPNDNNVMITEVDCAKKTLDGFNEDKRYFALLYEPNDELIKEWKTNDLVIYQSNPVAVDNKKIFIAIKKKRANAITYESKRENYLCKHNNIKYKGIGVEGYINSEQIKKCKVKEEWDWNGKDVWIGADGAESFDNSSVSMIGYDEETCEVHSKTWSFIQEDYIDEKSKREKFDYRKSIADGNTIISGESVLDYIQFEDFVANLPNKYGVNIISIGYDIRNLRNSAQRWEREFYFTCVEVKQHSSVLHSSIKWLKELILEKKFHYHNNLAYENNFCNSRCVEDTNLNKYISKKISVKTAGKVDMVFATVDAMYLLEQQLLNGADFVVQT